jgi:hypothetical protein
VTFLEHERARWSVVGAFAIAMAWVEAACVYYLRVLVDRIEPYQANPLPDVGVLGSVELVREAATLGMLLTVGMLAGRTWHKRLGYTAVAFGIWDILYYVFFRVMADWPTSLLGWDVLFLLPLPWWGPVVAPVLIAVLMIVWGTCATQLGDHDVTTLTWISWGLGGMGIGLALYVFMADSLRVVDQGLDATRRVLPTTFNWPLFIAAFTLMAMPLAEIVAKARTPTLASLPSSGAR